MTIIEQAKGLADKVLAQPATEHDIAVVERQLGRYPRGMVAVGGDILMQFARIACVVGEGRRALALLVIAQRVAGCRRCIGGGGFAGHDGYPRSGKKEKPGSAAGWRCAAG